LDLYIFIPPQYKELSTNKIWIEELYVAAIWETSENAARTFAKDFYSGYNQSWVIRRIGSAPREEEEEEEWD
jgi:hypothetical protein